MLVKVVFLFPTNMKLPFSQKSKDDLFPKSTRKGGIFGITEKDDIHPRKDELAFFTVMETFLSVFIYCFPIIKKQTGNLIYRVEI